MFKKSKYIGFILIGYIFSFLDFFQGVFFLLQYFFEVCVCYSFGFYCNGDGVFLLVSFDVKCFAF